jgi:hypothetical protein
MAAGRGGRSGAIPWLLLRAGGWIPLAGRAPATLAGAAAGGGGFGISDVAVSVPHRQPPPPPGPRPQQQAAQQARSLFSGGEPGGAFAPPDRQAPPAGFALSGQKGWAGGGDLGAPPAQHEQAPPGYSSFGLPPPGFLSQPGAFSFAGRGGDGDAMLPDSAPPAGLLSHDLLGQIGGLGGGSSSYGGLGFGGAHGVQQPPQGVGADGRQAGARVGLALFGRPAWNLAAWLSLCMQVCWDARVCWSCACALRRGRRLECLACLTAACLVLCREEPHPVLSAGDGCSPERWYASFVVHTIFSPRRAAVQYLKDL